MRITAKRAIGQLLLLLTVASFFACSGRKDETPVIPPVTSPLTRDHIGYGVITASFTHITSEPSEDSSSLGYLRRGSLVRIIKRQNVKTGVAFESWVRVDGVQNGWLKEEVMDIYNTESQAKTASESILR
jgi:hypothetical protein